MQQRKLEISSPAYPHDAAQALPTEHEVECLVDLREGHAVRDELLHSYTHKMHTTSSQLDQFLIHLLP